MSLPVFNWAKFPSQWDLQLLLKIKKKRKIFKIIQIYKNLKHFMKYRSNSNNKAEKQMFGAKIDRMIKL